MTEGTALRFKHWTIITLFSLLLLLLLSAGTVYVVDPFEHYRQASFYTPLYDNQVYCNSGIARHYDYDAVLLGSSMVENTRASSLDEHFGVRSVKLPFKGGYPYNYARVMDLAFEDRRWRRSSTAWTSPALRCRTTVPPARCLNTSGTRTRWTTCAMCST